MNNPSLTSDARGASRLVVDLTLLVTDLVETMHHNVVRRPGVLGRATFERTRGITGLVYRSVRGVTRLVGGGIDAALVPLAAIERARVPSSRRDRVVAALNGILGDRLEASANPLAIPMHLRYDGRPLPLDAAHIAAALPRASRRVMVMVHGLCLSDRNWRRGTHDHGRALGSALGADVLHLRYNSGRHISTNGAELAVLLEQLVGQWPRTLGELVLIGHSMGGLLARSACAHALRTGQTWPGLLRGLVFLGTPHHGAPMERAGQGVDLLLAASPYTAAFTRLARLRSAGITDLRHGAILDADWQGRDRFHHRGDAREPHPLPSGVRCYAIAGSLGKAPSPGGRAPRSDGLVPVASALGQHASPQRDLALPPSRQAIVYGTGHLDLLSSATVLAQMLRWLAPRQRAAPRERLSGRSPAA